MSEVSNPWALVLTARANVVIEQMILEAARKFFMNRRPGGAFRAVTEYKTRLLGRGLSSATVNRRLASLRSLVKFCRAAGLVSWRLEVQDVKSERRRDSAGPSRDVIQAALNLCRQRDDAKGVRDAAIIRLLFDLVLRRGEVANLDLSLI